MCKQFFSNPHDINLCLTVFLPMLYLIFIGFNYCIAPATHKDADFGRVFLFIFFYCSLDRECAKTHRDTIAHDEGKTKMSNVENEQLEG